VQGQHAHPESPPRRPSGGCPNSPMAILHDGNQHHKQRSAPNVLDPKLSFPARQRALPLGDS
jgi:hypothetical protein